MNGMLRSRFMALLLDAFPSSPPIHHASKTCKSLMLFPVGPVMMLSSKASNNGNALNSTNAWSSGRPRDRARSLVVPSTIAPAAELFPSIPSVPALSTAIFSPATLVAQYSANCWFLPPTPTRPAWPPIFTVTSPPEIRQTRELLAAAPAVSPAGNSRQPHNPSHHNCCRFSRSTVHCRQSSQPLARHSRSTVTPTSVNP